MRRAKPGNADAFWRRRFSSLDRLQDQTLHRVKRLEGSDGGLVMRGHCAVKVLVRDAAADDDDTAEAIRFSPCSADDPSLSEVDEEYLCRTCFTDEAGELEVRHEDVEDTDAPGMGVAND